MLQAWSVDAEARSFSVGSWPREALGVPSEEKQAPGFCVTRVCCCDLHFPRERMQNDVRRAGFFSTRHCFGESLRVAPCDVVPKMSLKVVLHQRQEPCGGLCGLRDCTPSPAGWQVATGSLSNRPTGPFAGGSGEAGGSWSERVGLWGEYRPEALAVVVSCVPAAPTFRATMPPHHVAVPP